ncbi:peptidase inhibitor family I36 protein [Actinosynnema sp. NPDC053489]|uniref:peptidase inhibitor family I36 protein n=1 Tax=Actinosynnema sp. NPDC053489 TaxID=3363916 RepID=UPI0037C73FC7
MEITSNVRRALVRSGAVVSAVVLASLAVHPAADAAATGPLAPDVARALAGHPGGVQVSDNAVAWAGGRVVLVLASPGEAVAPKGLGANPRHRAVRAAGLTGLVDPAGVRDVHGCPSGVTKKDNYCFYENRDFGGHRWQFADTCADSAGDWGFSNKTSSWVNTDTDKTIIAYSGSTRLWDEPEKSVSSYVGDAKNDKMTRWDCHS